MTYYEKRMVGIEGQVGVRHAVKESYKQSFREQKNKLFPNGVNLQDQLLINMFQQNYASDNFGRGNDFSQVPLVQQRPKSFSPGRQNRLSQDLPFSQGQDEQELNVSGGDAGVRHDTNLMSDGNGEDLP